jgi:hypothetical protein
MTQSSAAMSEHALSVTERRARIVKQIRADTGIDESMIERLVHSFYARVARRCPYRPDLRCARQRLGSKHPGSLDIHHRSARSPVDIAPMSNVLPGGLAVIAFLRAIGDTPHAE